MTSQLLSILSFRLALALIHGIIYASVVLPWQAPDQPAQLEQIGAALTDTEWHSTAGVFVIISIGVMDWGV